MQPPTISGPTAASGPMNGLNSPTVSVDPGELPPPWVLPPPRELPQPWELPLPEELHAATDRSASAAASAVTASLIKHLSNDGRQHRGARRGLSGVLAGQQRDGLDFYQCLWDGERADL